MQAAVQQVIVGWRARGHLIGFGLGVAAGPATVGQIGFEGRADYTAIGDAVNRASRLCASAEDRQILIDAAVADAVRDKIALRVLGLRRLKGYDRQLAVYCVDSGTVHRRPTDAPPDP